MSNRFHNKYHRHNHHTDPTSGPQYPDSAYDPIASRQSPFKGEFFAANQITSNDSLSARVNVYATNALISGNVIVDNNLTIHGESQFDEAVNIDDTFTVNGPSTLNGTLNVNGNTTLNGTLVTNLDALFNSNTEVVGNLTVRSNLNVLGTTTTLDTEVVVTSAMDIVNNNTGPALQVTQTGEYPVAQFFDDNYPALVVQGTGGSPGYVGVGTLNPNKHLTVIGDISATNLIYAREYDFGSLERPSLTGVKQALDDFLYVTPAFSFVRINSNAFVELEVGQSLVAPVITWDSNKTEDQAITTFVITRPTAATQSGNFAFQSYNDPGTYTINQLPGTDTQRVSSWGLSLTDWKGTAAAGSVSAYWRYRIYFGTTSQTTPNTSEVITRAQTVNGGTSQLATTRTGLGIKTLSPSNQYFYFAYPQRFGQTSQIRVNGLLSTSFTEQTISSFNNGVGGTDNYYVYRSNNLLTSTYQIEIV